MFELLIGVRFGEHCVAVGERHGAALRVPGGELDRDGSSGVAPVGGPRAKGNPFEIIRGRKMGLYTL
jgi:hypothetical protein